MNEPKAPMPPQIQKCHDVWANSLGGQKRIVALEIEKLIAVLKQDFIIRYAARAFMAVHRLTQRRRNR